MGHSSIHEGPSANMLPDYPKLKGDLERLLLNYCEQQVYRCMGLLGTIDKLRQFEGTGQTTVWDNGEEDQVPMMLSSSTIAITHDEFWTMTFEDVVRKINELAASVASQISRGIYARLDAITGRTGMVVDAGGKKLSADHIFELLSRIRVDFSSDGAPKLPDIHVHPSLAESLSKLFSEIENDPAARKRFSTLIEAKREEWRAREADRNLVG